MLLRDSESESSIHIDFVPLADVLFNLLIFFLLATTIAQVEREINVALPFASAAGPITQALREMVVNVDRDGHIVMSGRTIEPEELRAAVEQAIAVNPDQKVTIRGDRAASYANIVRALDACKSGGVDEPYLDTVPTE